MPEDNSDMINIGGQQVSLADLANMDTTNIEEKRFESFPVGVFSWLVTSAKLTALEKDGKKIPAIMVTAVCEDIHGLAVPRADLGESLKGNEKSEIFRMNTQAPQDFVGYFKAYASDCGFMGSGTLQEILTGFTGTRYIAPILHRRNPNDEDRPYVNLDRDKIQAMAPHVAAIAEAVAETAVQMPQVTQPAVGPQVPVNAATPPAAQ